MDIYEYVKGFKNYPILFVGSGISRRYLLNSYSWEGLLEKVSVDISGNENFYIDVKDETRDEDGRYSLPKVASLLEKHIRKVCAQGTHDKNGIWEDVNQKFYKYQRAGISVTRLQIYIAQLLGELKYRPHMETELELFKKIGKKVRCVVTTNYDNLIEDTLGFTPLIGNDILLSNPNGAVYKIHGSVDAPDEIIITSEQYKAFERKYELIKARILAFFIESPIIFIGYSLNDENIISILESIFAATPSKRVDSARVRENFLLISHNRDSKTMEITDHDINVNRQLVRIKKLETDNFAAVYQALIESHHPVSVMDIRKVQDIMMNIYSTKGEGIFVHIEDDIDSLANDETVIAIGSKKTIEIKFLDIKSMIGNYFDIIKYRDEEALGALGIQKIQASMYFPARGFCEINSSFENVDKWIEYQDKKIDSIKGNKYNCYSSVEEALEDISLTYQPKIIAWNALHGNINIDNFKDYILNYKEEIDRGNISTSYRMLICVYDYLTTNSKKDKV